MELLGFKEKYASTPAKQTCRISLDVAVYLNSSIYISLFVLGVHTIVTAKVELNYHNKYKNLKNWRTTGEMSHNSLEIKSKLQEHSIET